MTHFEIGDLLRAARSIPVPVGYRAARLPVALACAAASMPAADRLLRRTRARDLMLAARTYAALDRLRRMDKVIVTAINGLALGMGCVSALACDLRVIADDREIGLIESRVDMLAAATGTQRLVRTVGSGKALELLLDGGWLTATDAEEIGLVHRVTGRDRLRHESFELADRLAHRSPVVTREIKRAVYDAGTRHWGSATRREAASLIATITQQRARHTLGRYRRLLEGHTPLTDADVKSSLSRLTERALTTDNEAD